MVTKDCSSWVRGVRIRPLRSTVCLKKNVASVLRPSISRLLSGSPFTNFPNAPFVNNVANSIIRVRVCFCSATDRRCHSGWDCVASSISFSARRWLSCACNQTGLSGEFVAFTSAGLARPISTSLWNIEPNPVAEGHPIVSVARSSPPDRSLSSSSEIDNAGLWRMSSGSDCQPLIWDNQYRRRHEFAVSNPWAVIRNVGVCRTCFGSISTRSTDSWRCCSMVSHWVRFDVGVCSIKQSGWWYIRKCWSDDCINPLDWKIA